MTHVVYASRLPAQRAAPAAQPAYRQPVTYTEPLTHSHGRAPENSVWWCELLLTDHVSARHHSAHRHLPQPAAFLLKDSTTAALRPPPPDPHPPCPPAGAPSSARSATCPTRPERARARTSEQTTTNHEEKRTETKT